MSEQSVPEQEPAKQRFVDRLWGLKAVIAVALASVIIGGLGGAAIAKAGEHQGGNGFGPGRGGPGGQGGPGGFRGGPGGFRGGQNGFGGPGGQQQQPPAAPTPSASPSASPSAGQTS